MSKTFDAVANRYDAWFETPEGKKVKELELDLLKEFLEPKKGESLLEVGIGTGLFAEEFRKLGVEVSGVEPSDEMRKVAESRGFFVKKGYGESIPFDDNSFDGVLAMTSLEFSKAPKKFLSEVRRVAKPNGKVVIAVLNLFSLYGVERRIKGLFEKTIFSDAHFYTYRELKNLMNIYLNDVKVNSSVFFPPDPSQFFLCIADDLERFGRKYCKPFGALLVGRGTKIAR